MSANKRRPYPAEAPDPALWPTNPETGEPLPPVVQPGYYPGFRTMAQKNAWDDATRDMLEDRVDRPPTIRWFTPAQAAFWHAVFEHLIPQHDRVPERRIPMVPSVDSRLYANQGPGYRFEDMPNDRDAYALGEDAINAEAEHRFGGAFGTLPQRQQDLVLQAIHDGKPQAGRSIWKRMSVQRFWQLLMQDAVEAYYSHPWAWDEIGFGGPAYPRAYTRLEKGEPEPWEVEEQRYSWRAPGYAVSHLRETTHHLHTEADQNGTGVSTRGTQEENS